MATPWGWPFREWVSGGVLLSHRVPPAVPSALRGLASGFGMGPGVSLSLWPPKLFRCFRSSQREKSMFCCVPDRTSGTTQWTRAPEMLVLSSHRLISTSQLHTLPCFHIWPINPVVWLGASHPKVWKSHLEAGFPLRCFQRLSIPNVANQRCTWQYNWHTRGSSNPVLSY